MQLYAGLTLGLRPANERQLYLLMASLIGWAQAKNQPRYDCELYICNCDCTHYMESLPEVKEYWLTGDS